jgi:hypothetical protein
MLWDGALISSSRDRRAPKWETSPKPCVFGAEISAYTVSRPTKSAAKPAEKPSIIFVRTLTRKQGI